MTIAARNRKGGAFLVGERLWDMSMLSGVSFLGGARFEGASGSGARVFV